MGYFVKQGSIVRKIWGESDYILFIFAGAAAEFALNKSVDWLYFTGSLPSDPIGRLFSTVAYSRRIVFSEVTEAHKAIDQITQIHKGVENNRGQQIPMWAYRDVLYMLIDYSIRAFETLERELTTIEKLEVYDVFYRMGSRMNIENLPVSYSDWLVSREQHLKEDLAFSELSKDLFARYKLHLGNWRYSILLQSQALIVPDIVKIYLSIQPKGWFKCVVNIYRSSKKIFIIRVLKDRMLPKKYRKQIKDLDID